MNDARVAKLKRRDTLAFAADTVRNDLRADLSSHRDHLPKMT
jgi:hypothetical protein